MNVAPQGIRITMHQLQRGTKPILVGPWTSEVGYELLYWIPFVAWAVKKYQIDPARLIAVSRGGCGAWYAHVTNRYRDVLDLITPEDYRTQTQTRVLASTTRRTQKQLTIDDFDSRVIESLRAQIGACQVLHPSVLYRMFVRMKPWAVEWRQFQIRRPFRPVPPLEGLPARYVAVRCYTSSICPDTPSLRDGLIDRVRDLLLDGDVVLLNTGHQYDDHHEIEIPLQHPRLHRIADRLTPSTNLEIQTRVIAGATKFFGTYGGYAYLPPLIGVNAETVYTNGQALAKMERHLGVARQVFRDDPACGWLSVTTLDEPVEEYDVA